MFLSGIKYDCRCGMPLFFRSLIIARNTYEQEMQLLELLLHQKYKCVSLAISVTQRREFTLIHLTPCVRTYWCIDEMIIQHPKSADKELLRWSIDSLYVCHIQLFRRFFSFGLLDRPLYHQPFLVVQLQWEPFYYSIITRGEHILWHEYYFCYFLLPPLSPGYGIL